MEGGWGDSEGEGDGLAGGIGDAEVVCGVGGVLEDDGDAVAGGDLDAGCGGFGWDEEEGGVEVEEQGLQQKLLRLE